MTLTKEQLQKLQNLAALQLTEQEQEEFLQSLGSIISYLDIMNEYEDESEAKMQGITGNTLQPRKGLQPCDDAQALLKNVEHEIVGNSITVKSFVKKDI